MSSRERRRKGGDKGPSGQPSPRKLEDLPFDAGPEDMLVPIADEERFATGALVTDLYDAGQAERGEDEGAGLRSHVLADSAAWDLAGFDDGERADSRVVLLESVDEVPEEPREEEPDRTAAYDPPPDLFAQVPDPELSPLSTPSIHEKRTAHLDANEVRAAIERALRPPEPVPILDEPAPEPEPVPEPVPEPEPDPVEVASKPSDPKVRRPKGPIHRPIERNEAPEPSRQPERTRNREPAAPASRRAPQRADHRFTEPPAPVIVDSAENELTGIYDPPALVPELPRGKLTILQGEGQGKVYFINRNRTALGRGIDNDIVLLDISVSRKHLRIDRHATGFRVVDTASGNGSHLNGKRVKDNELFDGDRIELGSTTLEFQAVGAPRARPREAVATDPGHVLTPAAPSRQPKSRLPWSWVALWAGTTFIVVVLVMVVARFIISGRDHDVAADGARAQMAAAEGFMKSREWLRADEAVQIARGLSPGLGLPFEQQQSRIGRERDAQRRLDEARRKRGRSPNAEVEALLAGIWDDSVYYRDAKDLMDALGGPTPPPVPATEAPLEVSHTTRVPRAPDPAPPRSRTQVASGRPASPVEGRTAAPAEDRRGRAVFSEALNLYKQERFGDAQAAFDKLASQSPNSKTGQDAKAKGKLVSEFATHWAQAERSAKARRVREATEALQKAGATDRKLGDHFRERIEQMQAEQSHLLAVQAFNRQAYDEAIEANARVLALSPGHALASRLQDKLRRIAPTVLRLAQQARTEGDTQRARRLAQAVLKLSGENDTTGRQAKKLLDEL